MEKSNIITVGYWSTKGLGSVCRMVVLYSGYTLKAKNYKLQPVVKDQSVIYDGSEWHEKDKVDLKKKYSLINLPYIELIDSNNNNILMSQSSACLAYFGNKFKLLGNNKYEESDCFQLLLETVDLRNIITSFAYTHYENTELELKAANEVFNKAFENNNTGKLQKFEHWLSKKNKDNMFLINDEPTIPDFNFFDILDFYLEFVKYYNFITNKNNKNIFQELEYPNISNFYNNFIELPKMQKYLNSIFYKLPYTNKSARFGSGIKGDTWNHTSQIDETPLEIIIN